MVTILKGILHSWFPNRLNIVVGLLLLPLWSFVTFGFFSIWFHDHAHLHSAHQTMRSIRVKVPQ